MSTFFSSTMMRTVLAVLAMVIFCAVVWFVGPLFSFGGMAPLASVGVRVALMIMLLALLLALLLKRLMHLVGVAALCLLIWHAGPLLAIGEVQPLASLPARYWTIALFLFAYLIYGGVRLYLAVRADQYFMDKLLLIKRTPELEQDVGIERIKGVAGKVERAVAQLATMRGRGYGLLRLLEGKRYLYDLPWYVILGNSGAGKTTAIHNAGLQFPVVGYERIAGRMVGTIDCDWSFTNEAVFIDTAGRYATQESNLGEQRTDSAEWLGFLALLRKQRPRAPVNGVIIAISVAELAVDAAQRTVHAEALRSRLAELRSGLGICFPVYVVVTQVDHLSGFTQYFQSLTSEGRGQVWGCTLPTEDDAPEDTLSQLHTQLAALSQRLRGGVNSRLQEEFESDQRRLLQQLPDEFDGLLTALRLMLEVMLQDSRFDNTQKQHSVRGVYFTSAAQGTTQLPLNRRSLMQRLRVGLDRMKRGGADGVESTDDADRRQQVSVHGYFLHELLSNVIIPESHLVRPNLRWEFRFRMMKFFAHSLCLVLFVALAVALSWSSTHNHDYLGIIADKTGLLGAHLQRLYALRGAEQLQAVPDALTSAVDLPQVRGLDLSQPDWDYRVGLYSAATVATAADATYTQLQDSLLLPQIVHRMETVLRQAIRTDTGMLLDTNLNASLNADLTMDSEAGKIAYDTLRVYLQLHDSSKFNAADVKAWVLQDWQSADSAAVFGARASMLDHLDRLFSGTRVVQSAFVRDEELVRATREFLSRNSSTQRLYERAKASMLRQAPEEFSLTHAVGPQAGTVFVRASGQPLDKGIAGLFTYDGYHQLFDARLPEFVAEARTDDAWVMGKSVASAPPAGVRDLDEDPLTLDIRRQYLREYARHWQDFLGDIRAVSGTSIAFDLTVLRTLAAPDSPLTRLARAAARETTLSRPLLAEPEAEQSLLEKAQQQLSYKSKQLRKGLGVLPQERLARELVDQPFAALREVVTGQADAGMLNQAGATAKPALENIAALINQYYTLMVVADTALAAGSLPPAGTAAGMTLMLEAGKLPAPFHAVLTVLAERGSTKIADGTAAILRVQARAQFDRIVGQLAIDVGEACKRSIEGRYPFAASNQDVNIDDFTRIFAAGGAADDFFNQQLRPFVDTSVRPWRYKSPAGASLLSPLQMAGAATAAMPLPTLAEGPSLLGELLTMLAQRGPDPEAFARMQAIRSAFFREPGSKKMAWKVDMKVVEIDPSIVELLTDIDGQTQRYVHGPVQAQSLSWPGPRGGAMAQIAALPQLRPDTSTLLASGPWALFRLLDKAKLAASATPGKLTAEFNFDGRRAVLDLSSGDLPMPLHSDLLRSFSCPGSV